MSLTIAVLIGIALQLVAILGFCVGSFDKQRACGVTAVGGWIVFTGSIIGDSSLDAAISGVIGAVATYLWWKGGRGGRSKKTLQQLGAKSRALIRTLVERGRPATGLLGWPRRGHG
ncbi:MAG: hypothetical protein JWL97_4551 [Gemmatimonadales bacterium]|jgi:hypothetical protein|nr:hypothetical protein [Gemmatimonadales bacterium]